MKIRTSQAIQSVLLSAVLLSLAACGGGSSGGGGNNDTPPSANAGTNQNVTEKTTVQLGGSGGGSDTPLSFAWSQVSGTAATINNSGTANANFTAPDIASGSDILTFRLTVTDSTGRTATDDIDVTVNDVAPSADAGGDQAVLELLQVQLSGSSGGSDMPLSFAWSQISGPTVVIADANLSQASFTSPDVIAGVPEVLTFRFTVTDSGGRSIFDDIDVTVSEPPSQVTISGILEYELPSPNPNCDGLNFSSITNRPIRGATVQLVAENGGAVLDTTVSDDNGAYSFLADSQTSVLIRVRAELKRTGNPSWDVEVRDNVDLDQPPAPLEQRPIYVLDGPANSPSGADEVRNLLATHGWTGSSFSDTRSAAPFSVLDTIYSAMQLILSVDAQANFEPLNAFWSVNNRTVVSTGSFDEFIASGEIGTSFATGGFASTGGIHSLFLLGKDGDDIEEFDDHVIAHEWGHYFENTFSRSDNIGGQHGFNNRLDPRVAFGEGLATALSGMALNDPVYCDVFWFGGTLRGFDIRIESEATGSFAGWYNESSVMKILYDLWDDDVDGVDASSIGFGPIYDVLTGPQRTTSAFTTIFTFAEAIKNAGTGQNPFIDDLLASENITAAGIDRWGSTETNHPGAFRDSDPVYTTIVPDGTFVKVCSNSEFDNLGPDAAGNKLNVHRFLRMNVTTAQRYTFNVQADAATLALLPPDDVNDPIDQSDPDMLVFDLTQYPDPNALKNNCFGTGEGCSGDANTENFTTANPLSIGEYVIDFHDWRFEDPDTALTYPPRTCFDFTVQPAQ